MPDKSSDYPSQNQSDAGWSAKAKEELKKKEITSLRILCCVVVSSEIISLKFKYLGTGCLKKKVSLVEISWGKYNSSW